MVRVKNEEVSIRKRIHHEQGATKVRQVGSKNKSEGKENEGLK